jgi:hypothetical protein
MRQRGSRETQLITMTDGVGSQSSWLDLHSNTFCLVDFLCGLVHSWIVTCLRASRICGRYFCRTTATAARTVSKFGIWSVATSRAASAFRSDGVIFDFMGFLFMVFLSGVSCRCLAIRTAVPIAGPRLRRPLGRLLILVMSITETLLCLSRRSTCAA